MAAFDLVRFRDLAFGRKPLPDHPMRSLAETKKLLALLPEDDPDHSLAELTHWAFSMNATDSFSPELRARVLMELDGSALRLWRVQASRYLAPEGRSGEGSEGDAGLLRAMFDYVTEMSNGYAMALDAEPGASGWLDKHRARVSLRNMRALARRLALGHMLRHAATAATWERLHRRFMLSEEQSVSRQVLQVFDNDPMTSSVRLEYAHVLLLELAAPDGLRGREVELVFRIGRRLAPAVLIDAAASPQAWFAVVPAGDARPVLAGKIGGGAVPAPLYFSTENCLPRLRAALERDMGRDQAEAGTQFGKEYTLRESNAILNRLIEYWGPHPPQRRAKRITMATSVRLIAGFDKVLSVVPAISKATAEDADKARRKLQLQIDATTKTLKRATVRAARENPARLVDASAGGLGIAIRRKDANWAALGMLVAVLIEPGKTWAVGVLRRIFSVDDELRLGIQTLSAKAVAVTLRTDTVKRDQVWEEAMKFEAAYKEHFQTGILLEPQTPPLAASEFLLPPGLASRGTQFNLPYPAGEQRIRVTRLLENGEHYQRAMFESLGVAR